MNEFQILIVEDDPVWQQELIQEVRRACPEYGVRVTTGPTDRVAKDDLPMNGSPSRLGVIHIAVAGSFNDALGRLHRRDRWDMAMTDIALTRSGDKQGKQIAKRMHEARIPYVFVSGSAVLNTDDVRELLIDEQARDYFNKTAFNSARFQAVARSILFPRSTVGPSTGQRSPPREVVIDFGMDSYVLATSDGKVHLPLKYRFLFDCFARRVARDVAGEDVPFVELNEVICEEAPSRASGALRKAISTLNEYLRAPSHLGKPVESKHWVRTHKGSGYYLNTTGVRWVVKNPELVRELRRASVWTVSMDQQAMQSKTSTD